MATTTLSPATSTLMRWRKVSDEALRLQVGEALLYRACRAGELQHIRLAGNRGVRLLAEWTDAWMLKFVVEVKD